MNYSKRTKKIVEPVNMSKKETIQTEYIKPLKLSPLVSKVHYWLNIFKYVSSYYILFNYPLDWIMY